MSKGSNPRPYNITQFGENFDDIFNKTHDREIHAQQSEIMMGAVRQSSEQPLDLSDECEPDSCGCSSDE